MVLGAVVADVVTTLGIKHGWSSGVVRGLTLIINFIAMEVTGLNGALSSSTNGQIAVIAVISGIASYLQGGKFGHGFISAGISARIGVSDGIKRSMKAAGSIKKLITQVAIGGTVSRIGGGKFANGVGSEAFSMMLSSVYETAAGASQAPADGIGGPNKCATGGDSVAVDKARDKLDTNPLPDGEISMGGYADAPDRGCGAYGCRTGGSHAGVDLLSEVGVDIQAAGSGRAIVREQIGGYGSFVEIYHGDTVVSQYSHLNSVSIANETRVTSGTIIGTVGTSGNAEGLHPHLHFEVRVGNGTVNPERIFHWKHEK